MKAFNLETLISVSLVTTVLYIGGALFSIQVRADNKPEFTQDIKKLCIQAEEAYSAGDLVTQSKLISRIEGLTGQEFSKVCGE